MSARLDLKSAGLAFAVAVSVAGAVWGAFEYLDRYALASDLDRQVERVDSIDEDLHWIMGRLDGPGAPAMPKHRAKEK